MPFEMAAGAVPLMDGAECTAEADFLSHSNLFLGCEASRRADIWGSLLLFEDNFMVWFCTLRCLVSALDDMVRDPGLLVLFFLRLCERCIICNGVEPSRGSMKIFLRTTCDLPGSSDEDPGRGNDMLRCQSINEVQMRSDFENRAETRGFYSADFFRDSEKSAE